MTQHTPGPWRIDAMGNVWAFDTKVCEMSEQPEQAKGYYREKTDEEHRANAVLIAAAPDLLQCLEKLLAVVHDRERDDATVAAVNAAEGLIARVRGDA